MRIDETEQNLNSQSTTLNDIRKEFLSDIKYGQRHLWDKYFTLTLNIHDLSSEEISALIHHYKNSMTYRFLKIDDQTPHDKQVSTFHASYTLLQPFYSKTGVNFKLVFELLKTLETEFGLFAHSYGEIPKQKHSDSVFLFKSLTIRRTSSDTRLHQLS